MISTRFAPVARQCLRQATQQSRRTPAYIQVCQSCKQLGINVLWLLTGPTGTI